MNVFFAYANVREIARAAALAEHRAIFGSWDEDAVIECRDRFHTL